MTYSLPLLKDHRFTAKYIFGSKSDIVHAIKSSGPFSSTDISKVLSVGYDYAFKRLNMLVVKGILLKEKKGKNVVFDMNLQTYTSTMRLLDLLGNEDKKRGLVCLSLLCQNPNKLLLSKIGEGHDNLSKLDSTTDLSRNMITKALGKMSKANLIINQSGTYKINPDILRHLDEFGLLINNKIKANA